MPAKRKPKKHKRADYFRPYLEKQQQARRGMYTALMFWKACGHKKCLRAQACAADVNDCFDRLWPIVPERMKIGIRAAGKAAEARLSKAETRSAIERDLARWDDMMASQAARQAAQAAAEPAPQSLPIMPAASSPAQSPRATGPRIRVL